MHRLAIKRTTKKQSAPKSQNTCNGVCTAASRHSAIRCVRRYLCRDCRVPTAVYAQRCAECEFARGTIGYHSNSLASCCYCKVAGLLRLRVPKRPCSRSQCRALHDDAPQYLRKFKRTADLSSKTSVFYLR